MTYFNDPSSGSQRLAFRLARAAEGMHQDLVAERGHSGLSVEEVAHIIGVPADDVRAFERSHDGVSLQFILSYAHAVGVEIAFTIGGK